MGTRADFYIRKEGQMEWIGSKAMDGYPSGIGKDVLTAETEDRFRRGIDYMIANVHHATSPKDGWPWPWNDSFTTDYSYVFENGKVMAIGYGGLLFDPLKREPVDDDTTAENIIPVGYFPDMSAVKNVTYGPRSGLIVTSIK